MPLRLRVFVLCVSSYLDILSNKVNKKVLSIHAPLLSSHKIPILKFALSELYQLISSNYYLWKLS